MTRIPRRPQRPYQYGEHKVFGRLPLLPLVEAELQYDRAVWDEKWGAAFEERAFIRKRTAGLIAFILWGAAVIAKAQLWAVSL